MVEKGVKKERVYKISGTSKHNRGLQPSGLEHVAQFKHLEALLLYLIRQNEHVNYCIFSRQMRISPDW